MWENQFSIPSLITLLDPKYPICDYLLAALLTLPRIKLLTFLRQTYHFILHVTELEASFSINEIDSSFSTAFVMSRCLEFLNGDTM